VQPTPHPTPQPTPHPTPHPAPQPTPHPAPQPAPQPAGLEYLEAIDRHGEHAAYHYVTSGCRESAAMKRASMDLTRALVKVRRPR
jgi:hypothetical protein